jgi:hypothetical protein
LEEAAMTPRVRRFFVSVKERRFVLRQYVCERLATSSKSPSKPSPHLKKPDSTRHDGNSRTKMLTIAAHEQAAIAGLNFWGFWSRSPAGRIAAAYVLGYLLIVALVGSGVLIARLIAWFRTLPRSENDGRDGLDDEVGPQMSPRDGAGRSHPEIRFLDAHLPHRPPTKLALGRKQRANETVPR